MRQRHMRHGICDTAYATASAFANYTETRLIMASGLLREGRGYYRIAQAAGYIFFN